MAVTRVNGIDTGGVKTGDKYKDTLRQSAVSASQRSANDRGGMNGMFNPGTVKGRNSVGEIVTDHRKPTTPYYGGGGGSSDGGGGGGGDYSYSGGGTEDIIGKIKDLLNQQKEQADAYYKTLYEQQTAQNKQAWENNRNQINRNFARGSRYLQNMYGDSVSGQGLSNRARNYQNWQSNLAENQRNYTNNDATALSQYNMNKANTASQLAQGWYNYVLPVYTNRQQTLDDYDYRKYLASL